jgi:hypothetical protein
MIGPPTTTLVFSYCLHTLCVCDCLNLPREFVERAPLRRSSQIYTNQFPFSLFFLKCFSGSLLKKKKKKFRLDLIEFSLFWLHNQLYLIKGWLERVKSSKYKRGKIIKITEISQQYPPPPPRVVVRRNAIRSAGPLFFSYKSSRPLLMCVETELLCQSRRRQRRRFIFHQKNWRKRLFPYQRETGRKVTRARWWWSLSCLVCVCVYYP